MKTVEGFHFTKKSTLLDGRKIEVGKWQSLREEDWKRGEERACSLRLERIKKRKPVMCVVGYHASKNASDALWFMLLKHSTGLTAEYVKIRGNVDDSDEYKFVGTERYVVQKLSVTRTRKVLLLWGCYKARKILKSKSKSFKRQYGEQYIQREFKRIEEVEKFLNGGAKPKLRKSITFTTPLIKMALGKYDLSYLHRNYWIDNNTVLNRMLLKEMGI